MEKSTTARASGSRARTDDSPRGTQVPRHPTQPVSAARQPVEGSQRRPEAPRGRLSGGYTLGSGIGMIGSGK